MAVELDHINDRAHPGAARQLLRAAQAEARSQDGLVESIKDFLLPEDARLDERTRLRVAGLLTGVAETIEHTLTGQSVALLIERHETALVSALARPSVTAVSRLLDSGLASDPELMGELLGRVRLEMLAGALPAINPEVDSAIWLTRLSAREDPEIAQAASAFLAAENHRRASLAGGGDLPAELHHRMVWWVAAIIRQRHAGIPAAALDQALADAAAYTLGRHDEGRRVETAATCLAATLDARGNDLIDLLEQSVADRRLTLFVAFIGYGCGLSFEHARDVVVDPGGDRLWVALRAAEMPRDTIARIAAALGGADPRRDIERFADNLDDIVALDPMVARASFAAQRAPLEYRAAVDALKRSR